MAIDWSGVKKDFQEGGTAVGELAERYGCREATIRRRAAKEGWADGETGVGGTAPEKAAGPALKGAHDILNDGNLWKGVRKRLVSGLEHNDAKLGLEELKVAKMAGEVLSSVIKGERMAQGLMDEDDEPEEIAREMERLTLPPGAGEADGGE
ncbi:MAG: hypothetical protein ACE5GY_07055 [Thermodesulfobacteriota bacterium]